MTKCSDTDLAKRLLQFHRLGHILSPSDCILVLCSNDIRVAEHAAQIFKRGLAPLIVFSGAVGPLTEGLYSKTEAEEFADVALRLGVPADRIVLEKMATNTGENVVFSRAMLAKRGVAPATAIAVQKPYMERRTFATFSVIWPELKVAVTSPDLKFEELTLPWIDQNRLIEIIVGDLHRIIEYPKLGFQSAQELPTDVLEAFQELVRRGYTGHLIGGGLVIT